MSRAFTQWRDRVQAASVEHAQRALLGEIGMWRAQRLTDVSAQREATWALAELYRRLGEGERANHEAQQLLALCRTPPAASREALMAAEKLANRLSGKDRAAAADAWSDAFALARKGAWDKARRAAHGKGARAGMFRVWTQLEEALATEGDGREAALRALADELAERVGPRGAKAAPAPAPKVREAATRAAPQGDDGTPLGKIFGRPVPRRREGLLRAMDAAWHASPGVLDALAAAALRTHVAIAGPRAVAPWLIRYVTHALAEGEAADTRAAITELGDAYAVTAYAEPTFGSVVMLTRAFTAAGWHVGDVRRGILSRGLGSDQVVWTLRIDKDGDDLLVAVATPTEAAWPEDAVARICERLGELSSRTLLVAAGDAHANLRAAAGAHTVVASDVPDEVVAALATVPAPVPEDKPARPARAPRAEATGNKEAAAASQAPAGPDPVDSIRALFGAEVPTPAEAYAEALSTLRRSFQAFVAIREHVAAAGDDLDARLAPLLTAVHAATPETVHLAEGTSVALRTVVAFPEGLVERILTAGDALSERFGGVRILGLVPAMRAVAVDGWQVDRVLTGITRREGREIAGLAPLADRVDGLWRVTLDKAGTKVDVWWLDGPTPEALAAVAMLAGGAAPKVALVAPGQAITLPELAGTSVITWSEEAAEALRGAVGGAPVADA